MDIPPILSDATFRKLVLELLNAGGGGTAGVPSSAVTSVQGVSGGFPVVSVGVTAKVSSTFTRPADTTAYASGDLVANSTTAGSVTPMSFAIARVAAGTGMIRRCRLSKTGTSITNASFRLHLYTVSPTVTNGDNGVWLSTQSATYMGSLDMSSAKAFSDGAGTTGTPSDGSEINFALPSGQTVYGLLEARGAYTPASAESFTVELEVLQN